SFVKYNAWSGKMDVAKALRMIYKKETKKQQPILETKMRIIHLDCSWLCSIGLLVSLILPSSPYFAKADQHMLFKETDVGEFRMADFDVVWRGMELLTCVIRCVSEFKSCYSVNYKMTTKLCIPGSWLVLNLTIHHLPQAPGVIYSTGARCGEMKTFTHYRHQDVTTCYWISEFQLNYKNAKEYCKDKGAHLYTIKLIEKLAILKKIASESNHNFWIGLDDLREEGVFKWADDDSRLTEGLGLELFNQYQPDNWGNTEDCALLVKWGKLND
ncbi:unnamed protein product, partial [Lymnaea stagnalis]